MPANKPFWIVNKASDKAEIYLYGYIGYSDGVTANSFVKDLKALEKEGYTTINIRINSGGGSVYDGFAIFNAIRRSKAAIEVYIDGVAASMGTVIAAAGVKCHMSRVAQYMTHRVTGGCWGNAEELLKTSKVLTQLEDSICAIYAERTGLTVEECREKYLGNQDRWLSAEEALAEGLIDSIYDAVEDVEAPQNITDEQTLCEYHQSHLQHVLNQFSNDKNEKPDMKEIKLPITAELLTQIGKTATDSPEAIVDALNATLGKAAQYDREVSAHKATKDALSELQTQVATNEAAAKKEKVGKLLTDAVTAGKITAEVKAEFEDQYAGNPEGLEKILNKMVAYKGVVNSLNPTEPTSEADTLRKMSWDELHKSGKLPALKKNDPALFAELMKKQPTT